MSPGDNKLPFSFHTDIFMQPERSATLTVRTSFPSLIRTGGPLKNK